MLAAALHNFDMQRYIDEHRAEWEQGKIVRRMVWETSDYITFLNRGPQPDPQYHVGPGDEIFFQFEGELDFHYLTDGDHKLLVLKPGEMFLLPAGVPHSPRRSEGSWTFVVERKRREQDVDRFVWVCPECSHWLHEVIARGGGPSDSVAGKIAPFVVQANDKLREMGSCPNCSARLEDHLLA